MQREACEEWLLSAHPTPSDARAEWDGAGVAVLPLGTQLAAVRIPRTVVLNSIRLETAHNGTLDRFLAEMLWDGPVICDQHAQRYYALVPADTPLVWTAAAAEWPRLGVEILGNDWHLGVPRLPAEDWIGPRSASYWSVPMRRPGELCEPIAVARLIATAVQFKRRLASVNPKG
ncbi:hypothetical protein ACPXCS_06325 [Streptomyces sp. DT190]|uniref:hypothetical protein n=1 Tax=unclassified Streptomyces TaxID=2593676 RepID=UPI003CF450DA